MDRTEQYNQAIQQVKDSPPDYIELEKFWFLIIKDKLSSVLSERDKEIALSVEQLNKMVELDTNSYRAKFTDEQFKAQLDELHKGNVDAAIKQLEHERDNPEEEGTFGVEEQLEKFFGEVFTALAHWVEERFISNFEGMEKETGDGAKVLRGLLGISVADIEKYGILGGDNSYLRKIIPTWSDDGGLFGGDNSFFRKPFG
ncbi:hypothetical protein HZP42_00735 [Elizabethkingia anophelis]|nr:hypothetical protein [Elizabethkingia anophelis]OPC30680.1 hypothetical protein BAX98_08650 [Elizabethkingia anophelis]